MQVYDVGRSDRRMADKIITRERQGEDRVAQSAAIGLDTLVLEEVAKELLVESGGLREYWIEAIAVRPRFSFTYQQSAVCSHSLEPTMQPEHRTRRSAI